eukprot:Cvel_13591.t1-p1 / transcript=Cvel_13591.t1 / gene=Cvel_13591 / organism=Chromera_velia_CCMP2878 / gene_product=Fibrillin-1, putative / transcript_product=Fibrillin-1, putative / location=Cvel_scaffold935:1-18272(-) / protein_length=1088 / sequence_SO=supercontig / SO=protein_coding / is_pseudo=false
MHLTRPSSFSLFVKSLPFADTDECTELPLAHNCNTTAAACVNTVGSFTCVCNAGFFGDGTTDGSGCEQTNECTDSSYPHNCDTNAYCTDNYGSFTCACNNGYADNSAGTDGTSCADVDECALDIHDCDEGSLASCTDTAGSFACVCPTGYELDLSKPHNTTCTDVNECTAALHNCDLNAECTNGDGSFDCDCTAGYEGSGLACSNIDECTLGNDTCIDDAVCKDTTGSFYCDCPSGFFGGGSSANGGCEKGTLVAHYDFSQSSSDLVGGFGNIAFGPGNDSTATFVNTTTSLFTRRALQVSGSGAAPAGWGISEGHTQSFTSGGSRLLFVSLILNDLNARFAGLCIYHEGDGSTSNLYGKYMCATLHDVRVYDLPDGMTKSGTNLMSALSWQTNIDECTEGLHNCHRRASCSNSVGRMCRYAVFLVLPHRVDQEAPVLTCPEDLSLEKVKGENPPASFPTRATVKDNVDDSSSISLSYTPSEGSTLPKDVNEITVEGTDSAGNTGSCTFRISLVSCPPDSMRDEANGPCICKCEKCPDDSTCTGELVAASNTTGGSSALRMLEESSTEEETSAVTYNFQDHARPVPNDGFALVRRYPSVTIQPCPVKAACKTGPQEEYQAVQPGTACVESNIGPLCDECASGYQKVGKTALCRKCPPLVVNALLYLMGGLVLIVIVVLYAMITVTDDLEGSVEAHKVGIKIVLNFTNVVTVLGGFKFYKVVVRTSDLGGGGGGGKNQVLRLEDFLPVGSVPALQDFFSMECLVEGSLKLSLTWRLFAAKLVEAFVPLLTYGFIVASSLLAVFVCRTLQKRKRLLWKEDDTLLSGKGGSWMQRREAKEAMSKRLLKLYRYNFGRLPKLSRRAQTVAFDNLPVGSVLYYLSYKLILSSMLDTLKCEAFEEDLEPRLVAAKSIVCTSDAYRTFFIVALLIIILYVGILPSVVITLFAVSKKRLERQSASEILGLDQGEKEVSSKPREGENSRRETHGSSPTVGTPSPTATTRLMDIRSSEESLTVGGRGHGRDDLESEASGGTRVQSSLLISVEGGMESQQPTTLKNKDGKDGALETGVTPSEGERGRQRGDGSVQRSTED